MQTAQVIQTTYKGIKYRSRTEARWAVFFDKLGFDFEYEPEGYEFDQFKYLVDFKVPELKLFVEVKGKEPTYDERAKARMLAIETQYNVLIVFGSPSPVTMKYMLFIPPKSMDEWLKCTDPNSEYWGWYLGNFTDNPDREIYFNRLKKSCLYLGKRQTDIDVGQAMTMARNERFGVY